MSQIIPYLVFPGQCEEAMQFYASCLSGTVTMMQTFADSPILVAEESKSRIFNSEVRADDICIKASDDLPGHEVVTGTNISLYISFTSEQRKKEVFSKLSKEGKILFPIEDNFGMLKDKFGVQWMIVHE